MICTNPKKVDFYRKLLYKHMTPSDDSSASEEPSSTHLTIVNHLTEAVIDVGKRDRIKGSMRRSLPPPCHLNALGVRHLLL